MTAPYFPPEGGGLEAYALNISRQLASEHGWRVVVVTSSGQGRRPTSAYEEDGLHVYRLPAQIGVSNTRFSVAWRGQLRDIIAFERPALINTHAPVPGMADVIAGLATSPLVVSWHAGSMRKGRTLTDPGIRFYERVLCRRLLSRATWVIASSDAVRDTFLAPVRAKCTTVTPGIDTERFAPAPIRNRNRLLFVGGLNKGDAQKGLTDVLHAVAELARTRDSLALDVVGAGSERGAFETLAACLGIGDRVRFHGRLTGEALVEAFRGAAVLVLPTRNDSFPLVLLEAMACGLPIVSTTIGDIAKLVDDGRTGYLIPPEAPVVLAQRLGELYDNPVRSDAMGAAGRRKAMSALSWTAQAARTDELFTALLAGRSPSGRRNLAVVAPYCPPKTGGLERYAVSSATPMRSHAVWSIGAIGRSRSSLRITQPGERGSRYATP